MIDACGPGDRLILAKVPLVPDWRGGGQSTVFDEGARECGRGSEEAPMADRSIIVVGVDETASSRRALTWAAREAVRRGATLQVITAWTWDAVEGVPLATVDPQSMREVAEQTQHEALEAVLAGLEEQPVVTREIVQSTASEALVEASRRADLVVVGTHGRGPVRSFLLGSVSQSVIRHAQCPVVVMPPAQEVRLDTAEVASATK
jgi:nucleotide-binding universal stress UspA family protein